MSGWAAIEGQRVSAQGIAAANSRGTTLTGSATVNTKGSYSEIVSSTPIDAIGFFVNVNDIIAVADNLVDLAIGGAGSEQVILENMTVSSGTGTTYRGQPWFFPVPIPAGTRLAGRVQSTSASLTVRIAVYLLAQGFLPSEPLSRITTYGAAAADSGGTSIDPGGTANTKGAWSQIVASTTNPITALMLGIGNQVNNVRTGAEWLIDIGVGGAGSEQVIVPNFHAKAVTTDDTVCPTCTPLFYVSVPAGSRLAVRAQSDNTDATDRLFDAILYGVD